MMEEGERGGWRRERDEEGDVRWREGEGWSRERAS